MYETLLFTLEDGVAEITLNRPDAGNALDLKLVTELADAALRCDHDGSVRAVLLTGAGKAFSVGGDLKAFASFGDEAGRRLKEIADAVHKAISVFSRMAAPVIVAVNGTAAGAGFSLAIAGDYAIAAESARFTMAYTAAGLSPDGGATYMLPRLIGLRRTQELILTNRVLTAAEALDWGLLTRVVPAAELMDEAHAVARRIAAGPAGAHRAVKDLLRASLANGLEEQMELEGRSISRAAMSPDGIEGITAFLEKRRPDFARSGKTG